jgi:putative ABC transport system substrate-binding protein
MKTKTYFFGLLVHIVVFAPFAQAQQPAKVFRVGVLSTRPGIEPRDEVFRQRLRELGYVEGQNLATEWRFSDGKLDRLDPLAAELVRLKVDVIFGNAAPTIQAAKKATTTIPIVMIAGADPAESGLVASLERPGGNITGLTSVSTALNGKRMELAKEIIPDLSLVGVLLDPNYPTITSGQSLKETQTAADSLGLKLQLLEVRSVNDFDNAFGAATKVRAQALIHFSHTVITNARKRVAALAMTHRLPAVYADTQFIDAGGLMSLGPDPLDLIRRAAGYVDKILKGAKPADLPMEKPTKFEVVINAKVAKQIGLTIPSKVLARADKVIE